MTSQQEHALTYGKSLRDATAPPEGYSWFTPRPASIADILTGPADAVLMCLRCGSLVGDTRGHNGSHEPKTGPETSQAQDAQEEPEFEKDPVDDDGLIHHSDGVVEDPATGIAHLPLVLLRRHPHIHDFYGQCIYNRTGPRCADERKTG